jgi:hypothetical protein
VQDPGRLLAARGHEQRGGVPGDPEVKVFANVIKPNQSASSPITCRGS